MRDIPDIVLERYLLGELGPLDQAAINQRLNSDAVLRERLEALAQSNSEFLNSHDPRVLAHSARERVRRETVEAKIRNSTKVRTSPRFAGFAVLAPVILVALVAIPSWRALNGTHSIVESGSIESTPNSSDRKPIPAPATTTEQAPGGTTFDPSATPKPTPKNTSPTSSNPTPLPERGASLDASRHDADDPQTTQDDVRSDVRLKGVGPTIALYRRTAAGAEPLQPGAKVKSGDVIRIGYRSGGHAFGAIFSVDGNGNVTRHWPLSGERAARLEGGEALLPQAFELDAAPDFERFYLLTGTRAFDLPPVLEILHAGKPIAERGLTVVRFDLLKENGI